jgi:hypothetical protein
MKSVNVHGGSTRFAILVGAARDGAFALRVVALREGNFALYRGSGSGLAPILVVAADESSLGCVERLEHMRSRPNLTLTGRRDQSR